MSRFASWFATKKGRSFSRWCVGTAALSVFGNQVAAHGPLLDTLKDVFQVYVRGKPRPLPSKVNGLIEEVLNDSNLKEEQKKKLKFFYVVGHELFHAGGTDSPWGAIIGVPFLLEDIEDINFGELKIIGKETIDWVIDGQDLTEALKMTDDAKKFALMREIYSCNFSDIAINAAIGGGCIFFSGRMSQTFNAKSNALERLALNQRCLRYFLIYALGFLFYRLLKDPLKHLSGQKADKLAAETGIDYLNGGIEFYKKTLEINKALRELSYSRFKRIYDEQGNVNYFLLAPKLPISKRLENLQNMRKEKIEKVEERIE